MQLKTRLNPLSRLRINTAVLPKSISLNGVGRQNLALLYRHLMSRWLEFKVIHFPTSWLVSQRYGADWYSSNSLKLYSEDFLLLITEIATCLGLLQCLQVAARVTESYKHIHKWPL